MPFIPINKVAFEGQLNNNIDKGKNRMLLGLNCSIRSLSPELQQRYGDIVDSITRSQWINTDIYEELEKAIKKYEEGEVTLDESLEELEAKITLYLNE